MFAFYYVSGSNPRGAAVSENRLRELRDGDLFGEEIRVPLEHPMSDYFTATVRAGSAPSDWLDLLGTRAGGAREISYARIRLSEPTPKQTP